MGWAKKRDPQLPAIPAYHHPDRCMNCGHLKEQHDDGEIGCLVEGGTKYLHDEITGQELRACNCHGFIPAPEDKEQ